MSNSTRKQVPTKGNGARTPQPLSNRKPHQPAISPVPNDRRHAALQGGPKVALSAQKWKNVNQAIEKTVDIVLSKKTALKGFGPDCWEMDGGFGVALVAEIRREIKEDCTLDNPKLQKKLKEVARDVTAKEFRFPFKGGGVWFWFKITDLHKATQPITEIQQAGTPSGADTIIKGTDDETGTTDRGGDPAQHKRESAAEETPSELHFDSH
ncbi:uncharacterized protein F4817DRAFT_368261 [Daldinia loculata]|uniref:uncharacterized protein n=1 Tax=Daldinia loculata TaxID=103429 RepID=UPI0020C3940D|nr:uncharacterized protein F4817DRAFT_368261 [Daldinia loculata]KAI1643604.1 hypothetical protein F4817DRAFT_368261 [Daldinia loculata]